VVAFVKGFCVSSVFSAVASPLFSVRCDSSIPMFPVFSAVGFGPSLVVEATPSSVEFGSLLVVTPELSSVGLVSFLVVPFACGFY